MIVLKMGGIHTISIFFLVFLKLRDELYVKFREHYY